MHESLSFLMAVVHGLQVGSLELQVQIRLDSRTGPVVFESAPEPFMGPLAECIFSEAGEEEAESPYFRLRAARAAPPAVEAFSSQDKARELYALVRALDPNTGDMAIIWHGMAQRLPLMDGEHRAGWSLCLQYEKLWAELRDPEGYITLKLEWDPEQQEGVSEAAMPRVSICLHGCDLETEMWVPKLTRKLVLLSRLVGPAASWF